MSGATPLGGGRCAFEVWAPRARAVAVRLEDLGVDELLSPAEHGYHRGVVERCPPGSTYRYVLDGERAVADPASRSQPKGVFGPSEVFDAFAHPWGDSAFVAPPLWAQIIYELHVGTLTPPGTFDGAIGALDHLVELGVTTVELMPVAQFPGTRNWGYDGVFPSAVQDSYGGPAALQRFVDACHGLGLAVVLDVVCNHLGPEGNIFDEYGPYFTDRYKTPWGAALNFDGPGSDEVRRFFIDSALGWFRDFHFDALRLDAIHSIVDPTAKPFLSELADCAADLSDSLGRSCLLIAESSDNNPAVTTPRRLGGLGIDAQWNDDFHHALHALLTGERFGYYEDYGRLDQLARAISDGFVYQGEHSSFRGRRHGAPPDGLDPERFVVFAQNHDHIGNRPRGDRLSTLLGFDALRLAAAVLLTGPGVPLVFMGEEYAETAPFPYFVDHSDRGLLEAVRSGRAAEFAGAWSETPLDPASEETFTLAKLDRSHAEGGAHALVFALYSELIRLRRCHPGMRRSAAHEVRAYAHGGLLTVVRGTGHTTVSIVFNFSDGAVSAVLPLPPAGCDWVSLVDSGDPRLGGSGTTDRPGDVGRITLGSLGFCVLGCEANGGTPAPAGS